MLHETAIALGILQSRAPLAEMPMIRVA